MAAVTVPTAGMRLECSYNCYSNIDKDSMFHFAIAEVKLAFSKCPVKRALPVKYSRIGTKPVVRNRT